MKKIPKMKMKTNSISQTEKISYIIEQIPLIEDIHNQLNNIIEIYKDNPEILPQATELQQTTQNMKIMYEEFVDLLQKRVLVKIARAWDSYVFKNEIISWEDINKLELQRAMSFDKLARNLGEGSEERLKARLEDDFFSTINSIFHTFLENWSNYQSKIRDFSGTDALGKRYSGPYLLAQLLNDIEENIPKEIQGKELKRLMEYKTKIIERDNALTALAILPEEMVIFFLYSIIAMSDNIKKQIKQINDLEDIYIESNNKLKIFDNQNKEWMDGIIDLKSISERKKAENIKIDELIKIKQKIQQEIEDYKKEKEEFIKELSKQNLITKTPEQFKKEMV